MHVWLEAEKLRTKGQQKDSKTRKKCHIVNMHKSKRRRAMMDLYKTEQQILSKDGYNYLS